MLLKNPNGRENGREKMREKDGNQNIKHPQMVLKVHIYSQNEIIKIINLN